MNIKEAIATLLGKARGLLGVEIKSDFICMVELSYDKSTYKVESYFYVKFANPMKFPEVGMRRLDKILKERKITTKEIALAFNCSEVISKKIAVNSSLTERQILEFLELNLEGYLNKKSDQVNFDYRIINNAAFLNDQRIVEVVAVGRDFAEAWATLVKRIGLNLQIIDVDIYAIERAVRWQLQNIEGLVAIATISWEEIFIVVIDPEKNIYAKKNFINQQGLHSNEQITKEVSLQLQSLSLTLGAEFTKVILAGESGWRINSQNSDIWGFKGRTIPANPFLGMDLGDISSEKIKELSPLMLVSCGLALRVADESRY